VHLKIEKALQAVAPVELLHLKIGTQKFHLKAVAATVGASEDWNPRIPSASCCYYGSLKIGNPKISICKLLFVGASKDWSQKIPSAGCGCSSRLELKSSIGKLLLLLLLSLCFSPFQFWVVCKNPKKKYPQYVTNCKCCIILLTLDRFTGFGRFAAGI
jgi:hypothetical protein